MDYSILMSVYIKENPEFLKLSIESMLNQTVKSNDFVIVCDGPLNDELYGVLDFYKQNENNHINVVQLEENLGLGRALDFGLKQCKNKLVARMDSDDIAVSDRIEQQLNCFKNDSSIVLCGGCVDEFTNTVNDSTVVKTVPFSHDEIKKYIKKRNPFNHPTIMFDKDVIEEVGGYLDCYLNEDYYLWARVIQKGYSTCNIDSILVHMRAGKKMYERRGGLSYIKGDFAMQKHLNELGIISKQEMIFNFAGRSAIRIVPAGVRKKIYEKLLRK